MFNFKVFNDQFSKIKDADFASRVESQLKISGNNEETEVVNVICSTLMSFANKRNIGARLKGIRIGMNSIHSEFPMPPEIEFITDSGRIQFDPLKIRDKELGYKLDALCADYNLKFMNNKSAIQHTITCIVEALTAIDWKKSIDVTNDFSVMISDPML